METIAFIDSAAESSRLGHASVESPIVVQKFGGTSLGTVERIKAAAQRVVAAPRSGKKIVVVVSAMVGETDRLIKLAKELTPNPSPEELDVVTSTGEQVTAGLFALAIQAFGGKGLSLLGSQLGIFTDDNHTDAKILHIDTTLIYEALDQGIIPVITGFQGIDSSGRITTLGRGGSDTTAVALAAALESACDICTDVDGVFTGDPNSVDATIKLDAIAVDEMLLLAQAGSKVLHARSVAIARDHHVPLRVRSSFNDGVGTQIIPPRIETAGPTAISVDESIAMVTVVGRGLQTSTGTLQSVFEVLRRNAVPLRASSVTELSISLIIPKKCLEVMVRDLHQEIFA